MGTNMTSTRNLQGKRNLPWCVSTLCGLGFFTSMPGTIGSVAAFLVYGFFPVPLAALLAVIVGGVWASHRYSIETGRTDPPEVIIDEVAGTWIAMWGLPPGYFLPALFLFRIIDILKPFPVNASEKLPGGWGIMADDIVGGVLVNLILMGVRWLYFQGGWEVLF